jgi:hypothetical protein
MCTDASEGGLSVQMKGFFVYRRRVLCSDERFCMSCTERRTVLCSVERFYEYMCARKGLMYSCSENDVHEYIRSVPFQRKGLHEYRGNFHGQRKGLHVY